MQQILLQKVKSANIPRMIVTLGEVGAVYATADGESRFAAQPSMYATRPARATHSSRALPSA